MSDPKDTEQPVDDTDAEQLTQPATPEPNLDAPEAPSDDDATTSDEDAAYKDEARAEVVETAKAKGR